MSEPDTQLDEAYAEAVAWRAVVFSQAAPAIVAIDAGLRAMGHEPVAVVTARTRRNPEFFARIHTETPKDVDVLHPADKSRIAPLIRHYEFDLLICSGFPWLLPPEVLALPRLGAVNCHMSLLPRWRGPNSVGWAIRAGEKELGLTIHRMDERFDTGPILAQGSVPMPEDVWGPAEIAPHVTRMGAELLPHALARIAAGEPGDPQPDGDHPQAGFFEDDYRWADFTRPGEEVLRQLRAWQFDSNPNGPAGPLAKIDGRTVRITRATSQSGAGTRVECADRPIWILSTEFADQGPRH